MLILPLTHECIGFPKLIESGRLNEKKHYIVMSLHGSDSTNLKMMFKNKKAHNTILELGKSVLRSLEKLHSLGYVHWDVKPSNILYDVLETVDSDSKIFTLIDFGICEKYVDALGRHIPLTKLTHFNGSIEFIATEWLQKYRKF